jgi:DNA polymerase III delta prime subunit
VAYDFIKEANCPEPYLEVYGLEKKLTVNEARALTKRRVKVPDGVRRFVVIEDISHASRSAWNALLKPLENPPERTHFVLIGDTKGLPDTLAGRCVSLYFGGLENSDLVTEVEQDPLCKLAWGKLSKQDRELLLKVSEGSWGRLKGVLSNDSVRKLMLRVVHNFTVQKPKTEYFRDVRDYEELEKNGALPLGNVFRVLLEDKGLVYSKRMIRNLKLDVEAMMEVLDSLGKIWHQRSKAYEYLYLMSR